MVVGTTSSALPGPDGARSAYPARLEAALAKRLPGVAVKVVSAVKPRQTTADMAETFERLAMDAKPNLVIWQTGTFDAMRGTDADEFRARLEEGIDMLQSKGSDIILMNMQYSPRTESTIALGVYAENMRWVALQHDLPLFDRLAVMKHWSEMGTFDLYSATRNLDTAAKVHNCIAQLLAELVVDAVKLAPADSKDTR